VGLWIEGILDEEASGRSRGGVLGLLFGVPGGSWSGPGEVLRGPGEALEASWRPLGGLEKPCSAKRELPDAYGSLLEASWSALGPEKSVVERFLAAPREIPRQI